MRRKEAAARYVRSYHERKGGGIWIPYPVGRSHSIFLPHDSSSRWRMQSLPKRCSEHKTWINPDPKLHAGLGTRMSIQIASAHAPRPTLVVLRDRFCDLSCCLVLPVFLVLAFLNRLRSESGRVGSLGPDYGLSVG